MNEQSLDMFLKRYDSEDACVELLFVTKWPSGFQCSRCSCKEAYRIGTRRLPLFECVSCGCQHSLTAGTVMEGSRTPLRKWFIAIYIFAAANDSISAISLSELIDVTYKTAWLMLHKLRDALRQGESESLLRGIVRVQGGAYGSPFNPYTESDPKRYPLLAGGTISASGEVIALRLHIVDPKHIEKGYIAYSGEQSFIQSYVSPDVEQITSLRFREHMSRFRPLVRTIAEFGRWAYEVFRGVGRQYLQSYANEYSFRFNSRTKQTNTFMHILHMCMNIEHVPTLPVLRKMYPRLRTLSKWALAS